MQGKFVIVTTAHRGVFGGTLESEDGSTATLLNAKNCVYWSAETRGVFGLAVTGPAGGSRIGPAVKRMEIRDVTSISLATPEAAERWRKEIWS